MKKVVIVTGASSGIGKATAMQLIKEGHSVYGAARRVEKMKELISAGGKAVAMDITNHNQVHAEIQKIIETERKIDVLVNNAGYAVYGPIEEINYEQAKRQFDVNLFGLAEVTKAVLPKRPLTRKTARIERAVFFAWQPSVGAARIRRRPSANPSSGETVRPRPCRGNASGTSPASAAGQRGSDGCRCRPKRARSHSGREPRPSPWRSR